MSFSKFEYVNCNICKKDDSVLLFRVKDYCFGLPGEFKVVKCRSCGAVYLNPRPNKKTIGVYYPVEYAPHKTASGKTGFEVRQKLLNSIIKFSSSELKALKGHVVGTVLDVGCGGGTYMKILKKKGWDVYGVDASPIATERAKSLGLNNIFTGELHEAKYSDNYFDVVLLRHSLEHMHHPFETLIEIRRILKYNGTLLIVVPNFQSVEARIFKEYWSQIDAPRHLYFFTKNTIKQMFQKIGFRIVAFSYSSRPFSSFPISLVYKINNKILKKLLDNIISYVIFYILFWLIHRDTSLVVLAKKEVNS